MQFTENRLTSVAPATSYTEVTPKSPIRATFKVAPGLHQLIPGHAQEHAGGAEAEAFSGTTEAIEESPPYSGEERRTYCRRIYHMEVLLDTRSGLERRKAAPDGDVPSQHIDREI